MIGQDKWWKRFTVAIGGHERRPFRALLCVSAWALVAFVACQERPTASEVAIHASDSTQQGISATLADLRRIGEGCGVTERAGDGHEHGFSVPRGHLPFSLPAIGIDPATGHGDGRVVMIRAARASGAAITLACWVSGDASLKQIGDGVRASLDTAHWREMVANLDQHPSLPDSASRPSLSPAATEFASELLAPTFARVGAIAKSSGGLPNSAHPGALNAPACLGNGDCGCYTFDTGFDETNDDITVEFFFCDGTDSYDYGWMTANNYYEFACGGVSADERDKLAAMYANPDLFSGTLRPSCDEFRSDVSSTYFTWTEFSIKLQHTFNGELIGLFQPVLTSSIGPDSIRAHFNGALTFTSVYRDPLHNKAIGGVKNSRHMWGDAVDFANPGGETSRPMWDSLYNIGLSLHRSIGVTALDTLQDSICAIACVHMDWR